MKFIILVDGSVKNFNRMLAEIKDELYVSASTTSCSGEREEYSCILDEIEKFANSPERVMVIRFSGRDSVMRNIGEECSDMIIPMSYNRQSRCFNEDPIATFTELLKIFKGEEYVRIDSTKESKA